MNLNEKRQPDRTARAGVLILAVALLFAAGSAMAQTTRYLGDGAVQNNRGGWDLPKQGSCPEDLTKTTRPDCLALRLNYADQTTCQALVSGVQQRSWTTGGVCNDLDPTVVNQTTCESKGDRLWNAGTSKCAIVMKGDDRNNVVCAQHGGTWVTTGTCVGSWIMPNPEDAAYGTNPWGTGLLTGTRGQAAGTGDQCLRCHNAATQYNGPRVRDTEDTLYMGHKNMSRPVKAPLEWGGPPFKCSNPAYTDENTCEANGGTWDPKIYPSDDAGNAINFAGGTITVGGTAYPLKWIYGDWLAPLPRAIYVDPSNTLTNLTYSCGRCHTTGWTSDATLQTSKEPEFTFPGITAPNSNLKTGQVYLAGGVTGDSNKLSSWDVWGISCTRCHNSAVDSSTGTLPMSAPTGMSTHHNNLTAPDISSGACSDPRFTAETQCTAAGGSWLTACSVNPTPAVCTQAVTTPAACTAAGGTWTAAAYCSNAFFNGNSAACTASGATWSDGWCARTDKASSGACAPNPTVSSLSRDGAGLATAVTSTPHTFVTGETVAISGATPTAYNGNKTITVVDATTFTYALTGGPDSATGTIKAALASTSARTWRLNGTQASCQIAAATWSFSSCNIEGLCNKGTGVTSKAACDLLGGQFAFATDIIRCIDAGGHWTGNNTNRGQIITRVCMDCHRQETGGLPYDSTNPSTALKVGPAHGTVAFVSHTAGNLFLNSPHGKFTGTFAQIPTGKFNYAGTGEYKSFFMTEGEAANTGNGCTGCHDVHTSVVAGMRPFREECTACHAKNLNLINHPKGTGTPLPLNILGTPEEFEACVSCHMPEAMHLFRINVDASYSTFPMPSALSGTVNANTAPDGTYTNAVWADLDHACGQCHGGGPSQATNLAGRVDLKWADQGIVGAVSCASVGGTWDGANTRCTVAATGSADCASKAGSWSSSTSICTLTAGRYLQVSSTTGFLTGEKIRISDAGALSYDGDPPVVRPGDFDTYIFSTTLGGANRLVLVGAPSRGVSGKKVVQNATTNGGSWFSKALLATYAKGMHNDAPAAAFTVMYADGDPSSVLADASQSRCSGSLANCNVFTWNWGDGTADTSGPSPTAAHTFSLPGPDPLDPSKFIVTLTVTQYGMAPGVTTRVVHAYPPDSPPTAAGSCSMDYTTWTATCGSTSTDDHGFQLVSINWGDGSVVTNVKSAPWTGPFTHTFGVPGNWAIKLTVVDTAGQSNTSTLFTAVSSSFQFYSISGKVRKKDHVAPIGAAQILLKRDGSVLKSMNSAADGSYNTGNIKPGTYTLTVNKTGYTFTIPAYTGTVGPSKTNIYLDATGP